MRICILTQADTLAWTQHYVDAFRQRADVLTVGPPYNPKQIEDWDTGHLAHTLIPNDIESVLDPSQELRRILPDGWLPDLIVGISKGGASLQPMMDDLACPTAYLTIDTWQSVSDYVECQRYDFVFPVQRNYAEHLRSAGASNVHWLPLGCNPAAHYPTNVPQDHDVAFVGNIALPFHQQRYDLLNCLHQQYSTLVAGRVFRDELCRTTSRGRLAFNRSAIDDVNMRVFEIMAMRRPLLTNRDSNRNGLSDLFEDGKHLIMYDGPNDLLQKVRYYLDHEDEREAIARAGFELVTRKHRYVDRVDSMLGIMKDRVPALANGDADFAGFINDPMANLVPFGANRVLDIGLRLGAYLTSLRRRGAEHFTGVAATTREIPVAGYERILHVSELDAWPHEVDVVVVDSTALLAESVIDALNRAQRLLAKGGTLIMRLTSRDFSTAGGIASLVQLEDAITECGFHLMLCKLDEASAEGTCVVVSARKRTRRLTEIVRESCEDFPYLDTKALSDWAAAYGPHY